MAFLFMLYDKFYTYLSIEKRYSDHTVVAYKNDLWQFKDFLATSFEIEDIKEVSFPVVRSFVVHLMEQSLEAKTVNRKLSAVKSFFKYLRKVGELETNPAAKIQTIKTAKRLVTTVAADDLGDLLDNEAYFENDLKGWRAKAIIELLYATGIRRSELMNLELNDVDFVNYSVKVIGKRNKARIVPFPKEVESTLRTYQELQPRNQSSPALFFLTDKGKKLYPKLVYDTVNRYLSFVTTVDKKSPHILRHSYATHLLNKGADVNDIKELLGHANLSATQVYTHNSIEKLKSEYNQTHPREHKNK